MTYQNLAGVGAFASVKYLATSTLVVAFAAVVFVATFLGSNRNGLVAARSAAVVTLVAFLWPEFSSFDVLPSFLGPLLVVASPTLLIWLVVTRGNRLVVAVAVALLAVALVFGNVYSLAARSVLEPPVVTFDNRENVAPSDTPDVLFVLLDAYGRDDVLGEMYGFDNTLFLRELESLGFGVNRAASSNYNRTYASVASIMDLDYPIGAGMASDHQDGVVRGLLGQRGSLASAFSRAGYEFTYSENAWADSRCGNRTDYCWRSGTFAMSAYSLGQLSPLAPVLKSIFMHPASTGSFAQINELADVFASRTLSERPQVVWSHFILPHAPVHLDRSCVAHRDDWRNEQTLTVGDAEDEMRRRAYIDQLVCLNSLLLEQLREILELNPDVAIYVFGDHGPDGSLQLSTMPQDLTATQIRERLAVLLAVRETSGCYEETSADTLVTTARAFASCVLGLDIGPIPERAFLVPYQGLAVPIVETPPETGRDS